MPKDSQLDVPDDISEDEVFPPLSPSPSRWGAERDGEHLMNGSAGTGEDDGEVSKLADVPAAKRRVVKRPQPKLDTNRLISDRGLPALRSLFAGVRFKGEGHEAEDLRLLLHKMENWAHRLYPKLQFEDFIERVEKLGKKKEVQTCLKRLRLDMPLTHEDHVSKEGEVEEDPHLQIFGEPGPSFHNLSSQVHSTPVPAAPSPAPSPAPSLTEEQRQRIELNRQKALERKLARQQQQAGSLTQQATLPPLQASESSSLQERREEEEEQQMIETDEAEA